MTSIERFRNVGTLESWCRRKAGNLMWRAYEHAATLNIGSTIVHS